jgi:hypothetical protein
MTRNESECCQCLAALYHEAPGHIAHFLTDSVVGEREESPRLCAKSFNEAWSLGYVTSSVAEAANSRLKRYCPSRNQISLQIEEQAEANRRYLKLAKRENPPIRKFASS